jgi:hypothetical protein
VNFLRKTNPIRLWLNCPTQNVAYFLLHGSPVTGGLQPQALLQFIVKIADGQAGHEELQMIALLSHKKAAIRSDDG